MSERLVCDSCGSSLPLPTTPQAASGWQRLSSHAAAGLRFKYVCGGAGCDPTPVIKRLEDRP
jgi:hypothetical protein